MKKHITLNLNVSTFKATRNTLQSYYDGVHEFNEYKGKLVERTRNDRQMLATDKNDLVKYSRNPKSVVRKIEDVRKSYDALNVKLALEEDALETARKSYHDKVDSALKLVPKTLYLAYKDYMDGVKSELDYFKAVATWLNDLGLPMADQINARQIARVDGKNASGAKLALGETITADSQTVFANYMVRSLVDAMLEQNLIKTYTYTFDFETLKVVKKRNK